MSKSSGGHTGFYLKKRPSKYKRTEQQSLFQQVAQLCGIKVGISKKELQDKMKNCVPKAYKSLRNE